MVTEKTLGAVEEMISRLLYRNLEAINAAMLDSKDQGAGCSIAIWIEPEPAGAFRADVAIAVVNNSLDNRLGKIVYEGDREEEKGG